MKKGRKTVVHSSAFEEDCLSSNLSSTLADMVLLQQIKFSVLQFLPLKHKDAAVPSSWVARKIKLVSTY